MEGPRWFVLQNGFISYYDSEDDVGKGSKGSIKMSVCEIKVHLSDATRLDLLVPGEQHFYVRAVNAAERQCWLLALGSSKAGTLDKHKGPDCLKTKMSELRLYCDLLVQQASLLSATCTTFIRTLEDCMTLMQRSISHPGTGSFHRSGVLKEYLGGGQRSQRRNRTCSDSSLYGAERMNGDSSSIPEERGSSAKTTPTDTDTDLSI
ncbi:hypothetical protein JOQ06_026210 [Pogonophryne albipinna]|uniref:Sesquipedalian n=1 Tax=Pogonophryne albipinna TaxID=1090488 RepID=A0AAD6ABC8_9TELE|nr:hypothetical protein JOQ06_026210 [Pogonophryne albipinna]